SDAVLQEDVEDVERLKDMASDAPVIRVVNLVFSRALEARASDIHIEPYEHELKIRYRIDGVLQDVESPPARMAPAIISRVKILSRLNIAERRLPQDGRIKLKISGKEVDLRVSTVPTLHGESVVMRILDKQTLNLNLEDIGLSDKVLSDLKSVLERPNGIFLVTGPTGSGKTTTLYAVLSRMNTPERKIMTVEDPVEYQIAGVNQIQAAPRIGLDFAHALRSIVRQDPDVIMIGEMRDRETAGIAIQSALTGHIVFSTLHTNDSASGVTRLLDMGLEDYLLTSTVNAIMAQRLVRVLCPACRRESALTDEEVQHMGISRLVERAGSRRVWRATGCEACARTGYRGRMGVHELLLVDDSIRHLILEHASAEVIMKAARANGMVTMYEDGVLKAFAGHTSIDEVLRVTHQ
ncbi:MAG: type II secretion system ATPase GspE, partial [Pseudomonadales bacterium]|nr:type II secretion system ATPase GspE [Pseudomonadales bacterium]